VGAATTLEHRVAVLERRMNDHDDVHGRLELKVDRLVDDVTVLKSDVTVLKTDMAEVKTKIGMLSDDVGELKAGQVEIRDMVAKLLVKTERKTGRS
jgi:chromosome segregation ATPase